MAARAARRPAVSSVTNWRTKYDSSTVRVEAGDARWPSTAGLGDRVWPESVWKVSVPGRRPAYFYGESAWSDATRAAADVDFGAWAAGI